MKKTTLFLCALGVHSFSMATQAEDLGTIVITPTRTEQPGNTSSATVYVVDAATIAASGAGTTSELLRGIPGVQIDDLFGNGNQVNISVRGFSGTANANTLVLVNGRRMNYSDTTSADIHHIFPRDIERIEVLSGSAGALYGDQAVGGVINIITKKPGAAAHRVSARTGSYNHKGLQFNSTRQLDSGLGFRISAEKFSTDHYRDNNAEENTNVSGMLEYNLDANQFFLDIQQIENEMELPGALIEAELEDDRQQINDGFADDFINEKTRVTRLGYQRDLGEHVVSIDTTNRKTDADLRQSFRDNPSPEDGYINRENNSINPKVYGNLALGQGVSYVAGADLEKSEYELEIPNAFGSSTSSNEQSTESIYFQLNPRVSDALTLTFGMRKSSVENDLVDGFSYPDGLEVDDSITVREVGLAYMLNESTRLTARYDENFRFAKVNEQALAAAGEILETQTGESFELGINLNYGDTQVIASLYRLDLENEIEYDPNAGLWGENVNLDDTRRTGYTLAINNQVSTDLGVGIQIGRVDAKFESGSFDGNDISGVSDLVAKVRGDLRINDRFSSYLEYQFSSARYAQGDNANQFDKIGSITVYNAGATYHYQSWEASLRINNLFDLEYEEFVSNNGFGAAYQPSPTRNYFVTAAYRFE